MPPSVFNDVKDSVLRNKNRGAILANIFERYVDTETNTLLARDFAICTRSMDQYLGRIPRKEQKACKDAMFSHLHERGFKLNAT